jgi:hypothetical protein
VGVLIRAVLERLTDRFVREICGTDRRKLIRLVMTEGPRFPQLAEFHYHHVVKGALRRMRARISVARSYLWPQFPKLIRSLRVSVTFSVRPAGPPL